MPSRHGIFYLGEGPYDESHDERHDESNYELYTNNWGLKDKRLEDIIYEKEKEKEKEKVKNTTISILHPKDLKNDIYFSFLTFLQNIFTF